MFLEHISDLQLFESTDVEPMDVESGKFNSEKYMYI
jgi:hypothetical protein